MARSRQTSSGKAVVTGASLVLGQLGKTASQLSTLRARESTLAEKGRYRAAAVIAGEAPVGAVDVSAMPRRECFPAGAAGTALHEAAHAQWREECMGKKLRQRRTAAAYEKRVGLFNDWARHAGYDSFCEWEQQAPGRYELKLIIEDGAPRVPTVASLLEFGFLQAAGEIAKGGRREYRNEPQYRKVHGRTQGEALMPEAKRHAYGYGPYADEEKFKKGKAFASARGCDCVKFCDKGAGLGEREKTHPASPLHFRSHPATRSPELHLPDDEASFLVASRRLLDAHCHGAVGWRALPRAECGRSTRAALANAGGVRPFARGRLPEA